MKRECARKASRETRDAVHTQLALIVIMSAVGEVMLITTLIDTSSEMFIDCVVMVLMRHFNIFLIIFYEYFRRGNILKVETKQTYIVTCNCTRVSILSST